MELTEIYGIHRRHWIGSFYGEVLSSILPKYGYGFQSSDFSIHIFCRSWDLLLVTQFLQRSILVQLAALLDIVVIDNTEAPQNRFGILYTFLSYNRSFRVYIKTFTNNQTPLHSLTGIFPSAGWLEREAWDMFGLIFVNHGDLRRILTDYGFQGHPLRKDFPLMGFLEIRYDDNFRCLVFEPVELSQEFRLFRFDMPWSLWPTN